MCHFGRHIDIERVYEYMGEGYMWEISIPSTPNFCESYTALKNSAEFNNRQTNTFLKQFLPWRRS